MAIQPLTVADINAAIVTEIETRISATVPLLPVAFVRVVAKAFAAVIVLLYHYGSFIFLQQYVSTASSSPTEIAGRTITPLIEWGRQNGTGDPVAAVPAELQASITITNQTGLPIASGTTLTYEPSGVVYAMTTSVLRDAPTKTIDIVAISDQNDGDGSGAIGNLANGAVISFSSPLADVGRDATITATVTQGADGEDLDTTYRQRVLDRFQKRLQGGALADYEAWAEEAPGIINAYVYTGATPGTVEVYCEADPVSSGSPDGIPTAPQLAAALDSINLDSAGRATRRPANALAFTYPITRTEFEVDVVGLSAPDIGATQTAITDALEVLFASYEPFNGGLTIIPRDRITLSEISGKVFSVAQANNATFSSVVFRAPSLTQPTFGAFVATGNDDAEEVAGVVTLNSASLIFAGANTVGFRFNNVNVPAGVDILSAKLTFTPDATLNDYSELTIYGEAIDDAPAFTTGANDLTNRTPTFDSVLVTPSAWTVDVPFEAFIVSVVQNIVDVPGWAANNSMVFLVSSSAGSNRTVFSYDGNAAKSVQLSITYRVSGAPLVTSSVYSLGVGEKAKIGAVAFP